MPDVEDAVREVVRDVPAGSVATYGDVAAAVGIGPRQAGRLVGLLSEDIPWWRVVRADGTPARCHAGTAPALLAAEGVTFRGHRVDMTRHRDLHDASGQDAGDRLGTRGDDTSDVGRQDREPRNHAADDRREDTA